MPHEYVVAMLTSIGVIGIVVCAFMVGYICGFNAIRVNALFDALRNISRPSEKEIDTESAIVDDSPAARAERKRKHTIADDEESQIVTTKSRVQRESESSAAREAKLDKWMPGVKNDK